MNRIVWLSVLAGLGIFLPALTWAEDGGRRPIVPDSAPPFGPKAEKARLDKVLANINKEKAAVAKYDKWLTGEEKKLKREEGRVASERKSLNRQKARFRCPKGYTLEACFARPPVCQSARAFKARYDTSMEKLDRESKKLRLESKKLEEKRKQLNQRRAKLNTDINNYNTDLKSLGQKSKRSPDEGLFIDESVPKKKRR